MSEEAQDDFIQEEEEQEVFLISTLIEVLKKQRIEVKGIFAFETRCVFIHCLFTFQGLEMLLYIPSKYEIRTEKNLGIPVYSLNEETEDDGSQPPPESLFISTTQVNTQKIKINKQRGLNRFIPIFASSKYKIAYVENYFLTFINRHNSIDGFLMSSPSGLKGYYLTIDLQNFYTLGNRLVDDILAQQDMMTRGVFNKLDSEIQKSKENIKKAETLLNTIKPKDSLEQYTTRVKKINAVITDQSKAVKASELMCKIRLDHFKTMFEIENIAYILSELTE